MRKKTIKKIPLGVLRDAQSRLDEVMDMLGPYLLVLNPQERKNLVKVGDKSFMFVELAYGFANEHPEMFPGFTKAQILEEEIFVARELWTLTSKLNQLNDDIQDTKMAAGNHALQAAMAFYQTVKIAARRDIPGAAVIYEELKPSRPTGLRKHLS